MIIMVVIAIWLLTRGSSFCACDENNGYFGYRGPFLESPGKFSGPKSHFKTHEALDVQSFLFRQVLHLNKAYTYAAFRIEESLWFFSYGLLKLAFRARKLFGTFEKRAPGLSWFDAPPTEL